MFKSLIKKEQLFSKSLMHCGIYLALLPAQELRIFPEMMSDCAVIVVLQKRFHVDEDLCLHSVEHECSGDVLKIVMRHDLPAHVYNCSDLRP